MIQISRSKVPQSLTDVSYVVYAVPLPSNSTIYRNFRDALLTQWAMYYFDSQRFPQWKHFVAFKDDQDWFLFKLANGIVDEESVEIMDKDIANDYWVEYK